MLGEAFGVYKGTVANNRDPQSSSRVTLKIPQLLGNAESNWASPSSPSPFIPPPDAVVWVQFSGGDLARPVYTAVGLDTLSDITGPIADGMPPKPPTALGLVTSAVISGQGAVTASVTASWTVPTQNQDGTPLVDLDHYEIETSYDGTNWSPSTATTNNVVLFQNVRPGVAYYVRVVSVDHWGNRSTYASNNITTATSTTPPPTPSTPTVLGVLGAVRVRWDGLDNTAAVMPSIFDHVIVQRSVNGTFSDVVNIGLMSGADTVYDSSSSLSYTVAATYRLVPVSRTGISGTASATATGTPFQALSTDILDHSISTIKIALAGLNADTVLGVGTLNAISGVIGSLDATKITTGTLDAGAIAVLNLSATSINTGVLDASVVDVQNLTADKIQSGTINSNIILAGNIATGITGSRVTIGAGGIVLYDNSSNIEVNLPTDPTQAAQFSGNVTAKNLTVTDGASIRGTSNEFAVTSRTLIRSGLTALGSTPTVTMDYERSTSPFSWTAPGNYFDLYGNCFWDNATHKMYFIRLFPSVSGFGPPQPTRGAYITAMDFSGTVTSALALLTAGGIIPIGRSDDANAHKPGYGLVVAGGYYFLLCYDSGTATFQVRKVDATTRLEVAQYNVTGLPTTYAPSMGYDPVSARLVIGGCNASGAVYFAFMSLTGTGLVTHTSTHVPPSTNRSAVAVIHGGGTFTDITGQIVLGLGSASGGTIYYTYGDTTTPPLTANEDWPGGAGVQVHGAGWDSTNNVFVALDRITGYLIRYSGNVWTTASTHWWAALAWRNATNSYYTLLSSTVDFTMIKRARLTLSSPSIPTTGTPATDPDSVVFYIGRGSSLPAPTAMWRQTQPGVGITTVSYSAAVFSGTAAPSFNNFPGQTPASLRSDATRPSTLSPLLSLTGDGKIAGSDISLGDSGASSTGEFLRFYNLDSVDGFVYERREFLSDNPTQAISTLRKGASEVARSALTASGVQARNTTGDATYKQTPGVRVVINTSHSQTSSGNYQVVNWDDYFETANNGSGMPWLVWSSANPSRFIAPIAGFYRFMASLSMLANGVGARVLHVRKNAAGSVASGTAEMYTTVTVNSVFQVGTIVGDEIWMAATDYLELFFNQASTATLTYGNSSGAISTASFLFDHPAA